jgi:hypothetical protein
MPACIDTSVKLFVFLFVLLGVSLSAGSLMDTMTDQQLSANPSTNASTYVTSATKFSIKFESKPCDEKQKSAIKEVTSYLSTQKGDYFVQPESKSQNESCWCLNVGFRAAPDHKIDSVSRGLRRRLNKLDAKCGNLKFSIYEEKCDPSQFRFLEQSVGPDPNESKNLPCVSPATFAASDTNSGIRESGDQ